MFHGAVRRRAWPSRALADGPEVRTRCAFRRADGSGGRPYPPRHTRRSARAAPRARLSAARPSASSVCGSPGTFPALRASRAACSSGKTPDTLARPPKGRYAETSARDRMDSHSCGGASLSVRADPRAVLRSRIGCLSICRPAPTHSRIARECERLNGPNRPCMGWSASLCQVNSHTVEQLQCTASWCVPTSIDEHAGLGFSVAATARTRRVIPAAISADTRRNERGLCSERLSLGGLRGRMWSAPTIRECYTWCFVSAWVYAIGRA